eukprot:530189-Amphidinium_carterae.1
MQAGSEFYMTQRSSIRTRAELGKRSTSAAIAVNVSRQVNVSSPGHLCVSHCKFVEAIHSAGASMT